MTTASRPSAAADIPEDLRYLLTTDVLAHVSSITPTGHLATHIMWVDFDGDHVLTSSRVGSFKGGNWRRNPEVAVSVVDRSDPWRYVTISGRVVDIRPDANLEFIDRMSRRYTGQGYRTRDVEREIFVIEPRRVRASYGRG